MRHRISSLLLAVVLTIAAAPASAVEPGEMLADPALEARARTLSAELRCLVCQNQSIDDSNAPLAKDLRVLVRERLKAGDTDKAVIDHIVARYGEYVLLRPPLGGHTLLLWLTPALVLALTLGGIFWRIRTRPAAPSPASNALSPEEQERLRQLLDSKPS